ncbi:MAG: polysulfide reductase [Thermoanaerobaculia bacterium]|nr:MAG: polysulfide reductase [Thermoanaerobaculia bacterium]
MTELTTTRSNPMVDPALHVWGWEIPVYLFLGGLVAGMMVISGYFLFSGRWKSTRSACYVLPGLSLVLLSAGMLALFLDLEHKAFVWRLYTTFEPRSPMSWGAWILVLVYPALLANFLLRVPAPLARRAPALAELSDRLAARPAALRWIGAMNMLWGGLLGVYTGVLLSALGARPLWNSALLGPLFLISGLSAAAAFVHMIARDVAERALLAKADNGLLVVELVLLALFLVGLLSAGAAHARAADLLLSGPFSAVFWVGVVTLGIVVPLSIQLLAVQHRVAHTPVAPLLVIAGGLVLRFVIVQAGQVSHWLRVAAD